MSQRMESVAEGADQISRALELLFVPPVALHEPVLAQEEIEAVTECLRSGWVSTAGPFVAKFERVIAAYTGADHAVATSSGTAALHVALKLADVQPNDEVLIPGLSFVATANAVTYCGAIAHFVDVDEHSLGMSPGKLLKHLEEIAAVRDGVAWNRETGRRIRAMVPMHTFGHPVEIDPLLEIATRYGLTLVEDAAESLGSLDHGRHTGTRGTLSALSFNGNKIATTGGGGAILTNDPVLAERARHLTTTAKVSHQWRLEHDEIGFNYRLPNLNAALGIAQFARLDTAVEQKRSLLAIYEAALGPLGVGRIVREREGMRSNYWLHCLLLDLPELLEETLRACHQRQIFARPAWSPLHQLPMYLQAPRASMSTTENLCARLLCLPSGPSVLAQLR